MLPPSSNFLEQWDGRHSVFLSNILEQLSFKIHHGIYQPRLAPALTRCTRFHVAADLESLVSSMDHIAWTPLWQASGDQQHWTLGMFQDVLWSSLGKVSHWEKERVLEHCFISAESKIHRKLSPLLILKESSHISAEGHSDCFNWSSGTIWGCSFMCHTASVGWTNRTPQEPL